MNEQDLTKRIAELNRGAKMMDDADTDSGKLPGAAIVSRVGRELIEAGGFDLLRRAHSMVEEARQRTVELQWFGLSDGNRTWLP